MSVAFIPKRVVIQLPTRLGKPKFGAPVLAEGVFVITNEAGAAVYPPAPSCRPLAADEMTPELLGLVNAQLIRLGLVLTKLGGPDDAPTPD